MFLFLIVVASIPQYFLTFWNIKLELPFISNYLLSWILGSFWALYSIKILRLIIRNEKAGFFPSWDDNAIKYNDYDRYSIKYKSNRIKYLSFGICIFLFLVYFLIFEHFEYASFEAYQFNHYTMQLIFFPLGAFYIIFIFVPFLTKLINWIKAGK
tara:strand:+ start:508 stop:972 length:465 start_codon:yes stop_codon:yes gene_type:complete